MPAEPTSESNRRLLRARDVMDRSYAEALDIEALAKAAHVSRAHFIRSFRATFGETPHRYLQRRRLERAMSMLRESDRSVTEICFEVGFASLGTFSRTFRAILGVSPSDYRDRTREAERAGVPSCYVMAWDRPSEHDHGPSTFGEDKATQRT
ncbi:helix-turn-helix transcriptional regulator [soil metagenome]